MLKYKLQLSLLSPPDYKSFNLCEFCLKYMRSKKHSPEAHKEVWLVPPASQ